MKKTIASLCTLVLGLALSGNVFGQESTYTNAIGMEFILIEPGSMVVGRFQPTIRQPGESWGGRRQAAPPRGQSAAPPAQQRPGRPLRVSLPASDYKLAEEMAAKDAMPGFEVKIDKPYFIGIYEVTQAQWQKVMGNNPSIFQGSKVADDAARHPVENVTWQDAQAFIQKLNALEAGKATYRLPSEFEWEYAARAGATDDISWGEIREAAVIATTTTAVVGSKKPNPWGLYDTLGNVWEWTQDLYNEKIFADPVPPTSGKEHVLKGAPFYGDVKNATYMTHAAGPGSGYDTGFRVVKDVEINIQTGALPEGFHSIFNGQDLSGWHESRTTHQGTTPNFSVEDGAIVAREMPYGQGGLLMTDQRYKNFELYMEVKVDSFANGGIFLRSNEGGAAYQVELVLPGNTGDLLGERISVSVPATAIDREKVWRADDWNAFRIRMVGEIPHLTLWINGTQMWDVTQTKNDFIAGDLDGMIALQCHWTALYSSSAGNGMPLSSWRPGATHRYRNIGIKVLDDEPGY